MITVIVAGVIFAFVTLVTQEVVGIVRPIARRLVRSAAARMPDAALRDRYVAEWFAELDELDLRPISQLLWAIGIRISARRTAAEVVGAPLDGVGERVVHAANRVAGVAMFVLVAPVLAASAVALRIGSRRGRPLLRTTIGTDTAGRRLRVTVFRCGEPALITQQGNVVGVIWTYRSRIERILVRTSINELPSLMQVARGDVHLFSANRDPLAAPALIKPADLPSFGDLWRTLTTSSAASPIRDESGWNGLDLSINPSRRLDAVDMRSAPRFEVGSFDRRDQ